MKVSVVNSYVISAQSVAELPVDDWSSVEGWYVKHGVLHYLVMGETEWATVELVEEVDMGSMDTQRPMSSEVYGVDEDGFTDYDEVLAVID